MRASMFTYNKKQALYIPSAVIQVMNLQKKDAVAIQIDDDRIKIKKAKARDKITAKVVLCARYSSGKQYYAVRLPNRLARMIESKFGKKFNVRIEADGKNLCAVYTPLKITEKL